MPLGKFIMEPGEALVSVSAGDTVRWVVGNTQSGSGDTAQVHILVKPIATELQTNLMIATDRWTYHLQLQSIEETYMASASWSYPQSDLMAISKRNAALQMQANLTIGKGLNLEQLKFRYKIDGEAPWAPDGYVLSDVSAYGTNSYFWNFSRPHHCNWLGPPRKAAEAARAFSR